jgi:hypothetical protein
MGDALSTGVTFRVSIDTAWWTRLFDNEDRPRGSKPTWRICTLEMECKAREAVAANSRQRRTRE